MGKSYRHWYKSFGRKFLPVLINWWPPFRGAGIRVTHIAPDYHSVDVVLKDRWFNRNYVGVHFGGSLFAMVDPFFMLILIRNLGDQYIVWDKAASIEFKKPARGVIRAHCEFSVEEIAEIRAIADKQEKYIFDRPIDLINEDNEVVATVIKTLYVRRKDSIKKT